MPSTDDRFSPHGFSFLGGGKFGRGRGQIRKNGPDDGRTPVEGSEIGDERAKIEV